MKAVLVNTLGAIDKNTWDSIMDSNDGMTSYDYLMAIEKSVISDYRYFYILVYDNEDELISAVPLFITEDFSLETPVTNIYVKAICTRIRRLFPKFMKKKILFVGSCLSGCQINIKDNYDSEAVLKLILKEIDLLAETEGLKLVMFKDFSTNTNLMNDFMISQSYFKVYNLPSTYINLEVGSFDEYLNKISSKRRRNIRYKMRKNEKDISYYVVEDYIEIIDELYTLYENTYQKSLVKFEKLNKDFFVNLKKNLGANAKVITAVFDGKIIGFVLFICADSSCTNLRIGLDYDYSNEYFVYFMLHYKNIEFAIQNDFHRLYLGQTSYKAKLEMGSELIPLVVYTKYRGNPLLNYVYRRMYGWTLRRYQVPSNI